MSGLGRVLIVGGLVLVAIGLLISLAPRLPWLGRLPGDILIKKEGFSFYMPLTTSLLLSVAVSLLLYLFKR
ncbi:MAG: DUF2905 domain-containing protein [Geobacter sp.]|nr:DUF2905 domain-containing protein [Geobacter sp.]